MTPCLVIYFVLCLKLQVEASDNGIPARTTSTTLEITVTRDEREPVFDEDVSYDVNLKASDPVGTFVFQVHATDEDEGVSQLKYSVILLCKTKR